MTHQQRLLLIDIVGLAGCVLLVLLFLFAPATTPRAAYERQLEECVQELERKTQQLEKR